MFAALENLDDGADGGGGGGGGDYDDDDGVDIKRAWENNSIQASATDSLGYYELKQHIPLLDDKWSNC